MNDAYSAKILKSKATKKYSIIKNILDHILIGVKKDYSTQQLCDRLNEFNIKPLIADSWSYHSLQMQLMFIARLDEANSLARGFANMLRTGDATLDDLARIQARTKQG